MLLFASFVCSSFRFPNRVQDVGISFVFIWRWLFMLDRLLNSLAFVVYFSNTEFCYHFHTSLTGCCMDTLARPCKTDNIHY